MFNLIIKYGFHQHAKLDIACRELKERGGKGRVVLTGIIEQRNLNQRKNDISFERGLRYLDKPIYVHSYAGLDRRRRTRVHKTTELRLPSLMLKDKNV